MKDYVGIKIKGFKFENGTTGIYYHKSMDKNLDKIGEVIDQDSISVKIRFDDNICFYPISLAPKYVIDKKQKQKERIVEIMRGDEELGLYINNIELEEITPERLVALNFERAHSIFINSLVFKVKSTEIEYHISTKTVWVGNACSNAKTIEDINELIRLFE